MKSELSRIDRCELADHYEEAIMAGKALHVRWHHDGSDEQEERIHPYDLKAHDGKDYLLARDQSGTELRICIDRILSVREFSF